MARRRRTDESGATLFPCARADTELGELRVQVGVDEAGFGPLLGPLTIGCVALRLSASARDVWDLLAQAVSRSGEREQSRVGSERVCVGDSKAVFERNPRGRERLERTVLAFHAARHGLPADGRAFLAATPAPLSCSALQSEFWHASIARRLSNADDQSIDRACAAVAEALRQARIELVECAVRAIPPATLNASFARTESKGTTHWEQCAHFFAHVWSTYGQEGVDLVVDRHGGRMRYAALLRDTFVDAEVAVVAEVSECSVYTLHAPHGRRMRVTFAEKADARSFAVALASCCAKYARELCMDAFNAHFARLQPGLSPTAGYVTDARRWLVDAAPALDRAGLTAATLMRTR